MVTDKVRTTELPSTYALLPHLFVDEIRKCPKFSHFYLEQSDDIIANGFDSNLLYFGHIVTKRKLTHGSVREALQEIPFAVERISFPKAIDELNHAFSEQLGACSSDILWGKVYALEKYIPESTFFAIWQEPVSSSQIREKGRLHIALVTVIERGSPVSPLASPQLGYATLHTIYPFEAEGQCRLPFVSSHLCDYQIIDLNPDRYLNEISNESIGKGSHAIIRGEYQLWSEIGKPCEKVTAINPCALSETQVQSKNTFMAYVEQLRAFYNSLTEAKYI